MQTDLISRLDFSYKDNFSLLLKSDNSYLCELTSNSHLFEEEATVIEICKLLRKLNKKIVLISDDVDLIKEVRPDCVRISNAFDNIEGTIDDTIEYCKNFRIRVIYEYHMIQNDPLIMVPYLRSLYPEIWYEVFSEEFDSPYLLKHLHSFLYFRNLPLCFKEKYNIKITKDEDKINYREGRIIYPDVNFKDKFCKCKKCLNCSNLMKCQGSYKSIKLLFKYIDPSKELNYDNIYEGL